ncbi:hypothetical protein TKK_0012469 [Trichogramma kaykai]
MEAVARAEVAKLAAEGFIEQSTSDWSNVNVSGTMAEGGSADNPDICRCYTPDQTGLTSRNDSSQTSSMGVTVDSVARLVEDQAWQAETYELLSTQLFSPQPETLPPTNEGMDIADLIVWFVTDMTSEWPILC